MLAGRYAIIVVSLALLLLLLLPPPPLAAVNPEHSCDRIPYAANGTFQSNLNLLAATLPANASASSAGFATGTIGAAPDQANGLALCRGDTNASSCAACVAAAFRDAQQACPLDKGVAVYRDACVLRFAGRWFLDFLREDLWSVPELVYGLSTPKNSTFLCINFFRFVRRILQFWGFVTSPTIETALGSVDAPDAWFSAAVTAILTALADRAPAASNSTRQYFATAEMNFNPKIYGLAQCAPDLTPAQCRGCLGYLFNETTTRHLVGRPPWNDAFVVWCSLRYSVSPVYDGRAMLQLTAPPEPPPATTPPTPESGAGRKRSVTGISAGIACFLVLMLILSVFSFLRFRRRIKATDNGHRQ